jgi:hypothetical protein
MALATRVACNKKGNGEGGKSDGSKGDGQATTKAITWGITATRLASNKEGKGKGKNGQ